MSLIDFIHYETFMSGQTQSLNDGIFCRQDVESIRKIPWVASEIDYKTFCINYNEINDIVCKR